MPHTRARLFGSGYTAIFFGGPNRAIPLAFVNMINETPPRLVAEARPIHPLDWSRPAEIMTAKAITEGTIEVDFIETWSEQAWNRLAPAFPALGGQARGNGTASDTILDLVRIIDNAEGQIYLAKVIQTPRPTDESVSPQNRRSVLYLGAKVTEIADGDQNVDITTMDQTKRVTFMYTHRAYRYQRTGGQSQRNTTPPFPATTPAIEGLPALQRVT
jgi:hypothetical protein